MLLKCIVIYVQSWSFTDDKTGELREGTTCKYIFADDLKPQSNQDGSKGYDVVKVTCSLDESKNLQQVPGLYQAQFIPRTRQGRSFLEPRDFKFIGSLVGSGTDK